MGDLCRAEDLRLRRIVALKVLKAGATSRLLAEARAASALSHPGLAVVYAIGHADRGSHVLDYIAMEYVEGATLAALVRERPRVLDTRDGSADVS